MKKIKRKIPIGAAACLAAFLMVACDGKDEATVYGPPTQEIELDELMSEYGEELESVSDEVASEDREGAESASDETVSEYEVETDEQAE